MLRELEEDTQTYMNHWFGAASLYVFGDEPADTLTFAFLLLINSVPTRRDRFSCITAMLRRAGPSL